MKRVVLACAVIACGLGSVQAEEDEPYLFDMLAKPNYRAAYAQLIKKANVPDWVRDVLRTGDGVASPAKTVTIGGKSFRLDHVCKLNDCAGNELNVMFAPRGVQAWAALIDKSAPPVLLGNPKPEVAQALTSPPKS